MRGHSMDVETDRGARAVLKRVAIGVLLVLAIFASAEGAYYLYRHSDYYRIPMSELGKNAPSHSTRGE